MQTEVRPGDGAPALFRQAPRAESPLAELPTVPW